MRWLDVLRRWATADRIRASPRDGKLLRLRVGACVRVRGVSAQVARRTVAGHRGLAGSSQGANAIAEVEYLCHAPAGELRLRVRAAGDAPNIRAWVRAAGSDGVAEQSIDPGDLEVFG